MNASDIAFTATCEAIHRGDLEPVLNGYFNTNDARLKSGALGALFTCYESLRSTGVTFGDRYDSECTAYLSKSTTTAKSEILTAIARNDHAGVGWRLGAIAGAVNSCKDWFTFDPIKADPLPTTPQVLQVQVVSMPDRTTEQVVTRDREGNIVSATKLERDYAA